MRSQATAPSDEPVAVSDLAARIQGVLARGFPRHVLVVGEVSGFRDRTHWYFDLKDSSAVVSCVMFASHARRAEFRPQDGQEVVCRGRVDFWPRGGRLSLQVDQIRPVGQGALELAFRRLCEELRAKGWFDESRKRPIPSFARRIAVVTSRSGAALQDVIDTTRRRCPSVELLVVDARVQGEQAAPELVRTLRALGTRAAQLGIDAILVTRGGGSREDLWCFNDRELARAIMESPVPVVCAIGHESDTTIAELVADRRCATPTQAAMALVPDAAALRRQIDAMRARMDALVRGRLERARERVERAASRACMRDGSGLIRVLRERIDQRARTLQREMVHAMSERRGRLDRLSMRLERHRPAIQHARMQERLAARRERLRRAMASVLERTRTALVAQERQIEIVAPHRVLDRGFSWTTRADGSLVRSIGDVRTGEVIQTRVRDGTIRSRVEDERGTHDDGHGRREEDRGLFGVLNDE